jgi:hypothetical protein
VPLSIEVWMEANDCSKGFHAGSWTPTLEGGDSMYGLPGKAGVEMVQSGVLAAGGEL